MWTLDLDSSTNSQIELRLFKNVKNMKEIRKNLLDGKLNCCIIKPCLIVDPLQVAVAANKAVTAEGFTTKTLSTEILFNLSISKNISSSLQTFGIGDEDTNMLIASVYEISDMPQPLHVIEGDEVDIGTIQEITDLSLVKKIYKISDPEFKTNNVLDSVVSRIAIK
ncbi:hypothetical protein WA026_015343 [Henosepilachna vigintioctopunctata]|uniref:Uncharacterized protein n=1 Tax=Henosepilachna vigintioctopunctata TaxID=420089 RepID=A0AAW1UKJ8_9CUCU